MSLRLNDKTALITGGARGIGAAIARAFVDEGAKVVITDIRDAEGQSLAAELGAGARYRHLDVREESDWSAAMDDVLAHEGRLDVLVNNAGITGFEGAGVVHNPEQAALSNWRSVFATNLDGVFLGCRAGIACMRRTGSGSIINIASRSGQVGVPGAAAYAASKAAVRNFTKSVALYCAEQGLAIRCNAISPAAILTPMWEPMLGDGPDRPERIAEMVADCPMRRFGQPEEVAALAVMLASDKAAYMTGSELVIDGGTLAGTASPPTDRPPE